MLSASNLPSLPPRAIEGSIGSRIRVVLGNTSQDWLLLLNHDDGNRKWQEQYWNNIPNGLEREIGKCIAKGGYTKEVDFGPGGEYYHKSIERDCIEHSWSDNTDAKSTIKQKFADQTEQSVLHPSSISPAVKVSFGSSDSTAEAYVVLAGDNDPCTSMLNHQLLSRIKDMKLKGKDINFIRLFICCGYYIDDEEGTQWDFLGTDCNQELNKKETVNDIAVSGDGSWLVIRPNHYAGSNGGSHPMLHRLNQFYNDQGQRNDRRNHEIQQYPDQIRRREREGRESAEGIAKETRERKATERGEMGEGGNEQDNEIAAVLEELPSEFEDRIMEELKDITEQEGRLREKRNSLQASLDNRGRIDAENINNNDSNNTNNDNDNDNTRDTSSSYQNRGRIDAENNNDNNTNNDNDNTTNTSSPSSGTSAYCVICQTGPASAAITPVSSRLCSLCRGEMISSLEMKMY